MDALPQSPHHSEGSNERKVKKLMRECSNVELAELASKAMSYAPSSMIGASGGRLTPMIFCATLA